MKCPKCQTENPEANGFCRKCGTKLLRICPQCPAESMPEDEFCAECGHDPEIPSERAQEDLSFDEKLEKIQRYLPGELTENEGTIEPSDWWYPSPWYIPERSKRSAIPR